MTRRISPLLRRPNRSGARLPMPASMPCGNLDFDGIDIDWEFPGIADHHGTPADTQNSTLLLGTLRDSVDASRTSDRPVLPSSLLLFLPDAAQCVGNFEMKEVAGILDILNIMTYDFSGSWDPLAYHNGPLYALGRSRQLALRRWRVLTLSRIVQRPSDKITLGVPFYGHTFTNCAALLLAQHGGQDTVHFSKPGSILLRPSSA